MRDSYSHFRAILMGFGYNLTMNEMYSMSIVAHNYAVMAVFAFIVINYLVLLRGFDIKKYKRFMAIYNPISYTAMGAVAFSGVVMMAAKHLSFTLANSAMILVAMLFVYLEIKRILPLRYIRSDDETKFSHYVKSAQKLLALEFVIVLAMAVVMRLL